MPKKFLNFLLFLSAISCFASADSTSYILITFKLGRSGPEDPSMKVINPLYIDSITDAFNNIKIHNESLNCTPASTWGTEIELSNIPGIGNTTLNRGCSSCCGADSGREIEKLIYRIVVSIDSTWKEYVCGPHELAPERCQSSSKNTSDYLESGTLLSIPANQKNPDSYSLDGKLVPENVPISSPGVQKGKTPKVILPNSNTRDNK